MQTIERVIITALLRNALAEGLVPVAVWDSEEYNGVPLQWDGDLADKPRYIAANAIVSRALTDAEVLDVVGSVDDSTVHFAPVTDLQDWGACGVLLVLGNGEDIISDHHCDDKLTRAVDAVFQATLRGLVP